MGEREEKGLAKNVCDLTKGRRAGIQGRKWKGQGGKGGGGV